MRKFLVFHYSTLEKISSLERIKGYQGIEAYLKSLRDQGVVVFIAACFDEDKGKAVNFLNYFKEKNLGWVKVIPVQKNPITPEKIIKKISLPQDVRRSFYFYGEESWGEQRDKIKDEGDKIFIANHNLKAMGLELDEDADDHDSSMFKTVEETLKTLASPKRKTYAAIITVVASTTLGGVGLGFLLAGKMASWYLVALLGSVATGALLGLVVGAVVCFVFLKVARNERVAGDDVEEKAVEEEVFVGDEEKIAHDLAEEEKVAAGIEEEGGRPGKDFFDASDSDLELDDDVIPVSQKESDSVLENWFGFFNETNRNQWKEKDGYDDELSEDENEEKKGNESNEENGNLP